MNKSLMGASLLAVALAGSVHAGWHRDSQAIMGTQVLVEVWHDEDDHAQRVIGAVMQEMRRIDALMSPYKADSELSGMNRNAAEAPVLVSDEMMWILELASRVSDMTNGAFDVTFGSAGRHYDYRAGMRPDAATLQDAVDAIDYHYVVLDAAAHTVAYKHAGVYVDLGGIAKGYAVDRCFEILRQGGIRHGIVGAGGDSRIIGDRQGQPWTVGIKDPRLPERMAALLPLTDTAVSTSGDYERFFEEDGVRYHHILDPTTGDSARRVQSVTIIGQEATLTDALSTSVFVLGAKAGLALINGIPDVDAIIVDGHGELLFSDGLEGLE